MDPTTYDYAWIAAIVGLSVIGSGATVIAVLLIVGRFVSDAFATGEASAYRKQKDLPPVYTEGPPTEVDWSNLLGSYEGGDEYQSDGDPEPEPARVRVNMSGPTKRAE